MNVIGGGNLEKILGGLNNHHRYGPTFRNQLNQLEHHVLQIHLEIHAVVAFDRTQRLIKEKGRPICVTHVFADADGTCSEGNTSFLAAKATQSNMQQPSSTQPRGSGIVWPRVPNFAIIYTSRHCRGLSNYM